jgi:REase_DpnII-MboI/Family of unknown function (DUF5763)
MSEKQAVYSKSETLPALNAIYSTTCPGVTKSGDPCHAKAGSSGYCPMHNPTRVAERERQRQAQEEAERAAQAMYEPLQRMIRDITTICNGKGWKTEQEHFDHQTGRHVSLKAYRYFNDSFEKVSVLIEITRYKDGTASIAFQQTSSRNYGLDSLIGAIESDLKLGKKGQTNATPSNSTVQKLEALLRRFHRVAHQLTQRQENRQTLIIENEYDVQDLLHALLLALFDDIRPEDPVPNRAGKASRVDFLLKKEKIVIEAKMTSETLRDAKIGEQLIIDINRYQAHPDCQTLICFVYDPGHHLKNPEALENDLSGKQNDLTVKVIIYSPR